MGRRFDRFPFLFFSITLCIHSLPLMPSDVWPLSVCVDCDYDVCVCFQFHFFFAAPFLFGCPVYSSLMLPANMSPFSSYFLAPSFTVRTLSRRLFTGDISAGIVLCLQSQQGRDCLPIHCSWPSFFRQKMSMRMKKMK